MRGQNEARSPIVYSCSPRAVGCRPCPMVLSDHCRNCSVRLIPPYSTALFRLIGSAPQLRRCTQEPHGSSTVSAGIDQPKSFQMKQIVAQSTVSHSRIDLRANTGEWAFHSAYWAKLSSIKARSGPPRLAGNVLRLRCRFIVWHGAFNSRGIGEHML